jgi:hypothetical protein
MGALRLCGVFVLRVVGAAVIMGGVSSTGIEMAIVARKNIIMKGFILKIRNQA